MKWTCVLLIAVLLLWLFVQRAMVLLARDTCVWEDDGAAEEGSTMHVPVKSQRKPAKTCSDIPYDINSGFDSDDEDSQEHDCHPFDIKYDKSCARGSSDHFKDSVGRCLSSDLKGRLRHLTTHPSVVPSWARRNVVGAVPLITVNELSRALLYLALLARLFALTTSQGTQPVAECQGISVGAARPRKGRRSGSNTIEPSSECVPGQPWSPRQANTVVDQCGTGPRDDNETQEAENTRIKEEDERLLEENKRLREKVNCKLCKTNLRTVVFLPCGHMIYCGDCAENMSRCPECRAAINDKFLAR